MKETPKNPASVWKENWSYHLQILPSSFPTPLFCCCCCCDYPAAIWHPYSKRYVLQWAPNIKEKPLSRNWNSYSLIAADRSGARKVLHCSINIKEVLFLKENTYMKTKKLTSSSFLTLKSDGVLCLLHLCAQKPRWGQEAMVLHTEWWRHLLGVLRHPFV